jgi:hypothetical protein
MNNEHYITSKNFYDGQESATKKLFDSDIDYNQFFDMIEKIITYHESNDFIVQMAEIDMEDGELFRVNLCDKDEKVSLIEEKLKEIEGIAKKLTILSIRRNTHEPLTTEIERIKR